MALKRIRNAAFLVMVSAGVCLATVRIFAQEVECYVCFAEPGQPQQCTEPGRGVQGWTECDDTFSCSVWGLLCKDGVIITP